MPLLQHCDVDFETEKIENWPYPPKPVSAAIYLQGSQAKFLAWGHANGTGDGKNNCSKDQAARELKDIFKRCSVTFHNAPFDIDVGMTHLGLPLPKEYHCTLTLGFLNDPRSESLELKVMAEKLLGMPPLEQTRLQEWIFEHFPAAKKKPSTWGEYISKAPANIVAPYAIGDVKRNRRLFQFLRPLVSGAKMDDAYARELALMQVLIKMTHKGMPVDRKRLGRDVEKWQVERTELGEAICKRLGYKYVDSPESLKELSKKNPNSKYLNIDSDQALARALDAKGLMSGWLMTPPSKNFPAGQKKVSRDCLSMFMKDRALFARLEKRGQLSTYIKTFALPWLTLSRTDGRLHVIWNGTRRPQGDGGKMGGARTGRLSSSPNLQNVPKEPPEGLPHLRDYLIPEDGQDLLVRDFSQQEFRIFAHYEDAAAKEEYLKNPNVDFHEMAGSQVNAILAAERVSNVIKLPLARKLIKNLGFGILYGQGLALTAKKMGVDKAVAKTIRDVYMRALPGIEPLQKELSACGKNNEPIRTWGGRLYYVEEPIFFDGRVITFEYKLLNYLIQGSAADMTKTAMIRADKAGLDIRLSVHDELGVMSPRSKSKRNMKLLREAMEDIGGWDVPMRSTGSYSQRSWGQLKDWPYENRKAA